MAKTAIADVIVPSVFEKYAIERTAALSAFESGGIVEMDSHFDELASGGGNAVDMPYWQDITPTRQILSDSGALTVNKIAASKDIARIQMDGNAWSVNDLSKALSGADPMAAVGELVGEYWSRIDQGILISSLKGMFAAASMAGNLLSIASESTGGVSATTQLNGATFVDATIKLGDRGDQLTAVAMHSATEGALRKLDLIDFIPDSEGKAQIKTFQGRRVVVDDTLPTRAGTTSGTVYRTYLFGAGAFAKGHGLLDEPVQGGFGTKAVEWSRAALDSDTNFINRRRYILHPRGVKFTSASVAGASPTNAELETAANWVRVFENKNVRIVAVDHNN